ncbi:type II secretion system F family protein, partial [Ralstonia pseudosolanacearum]
MRFKVSTFHPDTARVSTRTVAAEDHASVETRLKAEGVMVLSVEPIENKLARSLQSRRRKVDAGLVCIELGGLLRAGLTVSEALDSLAHRDDHPNVGVYRQLYDGLLSGLPLSESMKQVEGVFPGILVAAIQANERSGRIPDALDEYAKYAQAQEALRKKVVSAAVYPATVIGFGLLVVLFLLAYVIPRFAMVYDGTA